MIPWHRLFGITLTDFFTDTAYEVEVERDLSQKQQLLDVVIIEKGEGDPPSSLPDGLETLGPHNLMTYKSHQQILDAWALDELTGHYVNYRKLRGANHGNLPPPEDFRLYAVAARYPEKLSESVAFRPMKEGVYDVLWGVRTIRIIVLSRIPEEPRNALWHLFSAKPDTVAFGVSEYRWRTPVSSAINELFRKYKMEGIIAMPYTIEDFQRDYVREHIDKLSPDEVLEKFSADERLRGISSDERIKGIPEDELIELVKKRLARSKNKRIDQLLRGLGLKK